jgi:hypothetical protein
MSDAVPHADQVLRPDIRGSIDRAVSSIPTGRRGQAGAVVTTRGVSFDSGFRPTSWLDVGGYAGRTWAGKWEAAARARFVW